MLNMRLRDLLTEKGNVKCCFCKQDAGEFGITPNPSSTKIKADVVMNVIGSWFFQHAYWRLLTKMPLRK